MAEAAAKRNRIGEKKIKVICVTLLAKTVKSGTRLAVAQVMGWPMVAQERRQPGRSGHSGAGGLPGGAPQRA
jgi:hypothetical protein